MVCGVYGRITAWIAEEANVRKTQFIALALALIASSVLVATPAEASRRRSGPGFEAGGYVFRANFDDESNIQNDEGLGARFGILFRPEHELEFSLDKVVTNDNFGGGLDVDLTTFKTGYVYNFGRGRSVSPFLTVGAGWQKIEIDDPLFGNVVDETDPLAYGGVGVRFFIGDLFNIRVDGQLQAIVPDSDLDEALVDGILSAGVGWMFGDR